MRRAEVLAMAIEALRGSRSRSLLTVLGVAIGVASIILLVSIGEGTRLYVAGQFEDMGSNMIAVVPGKWRKSTGPLMGLSTRHKLTYEDMAAVQRRAPAVKGVAPAIVGSASVQHRSHARPTTVIGTTHAFQEVRNLHVEVGAFIPDRGLLKPRERVVVLGRAVKEDLFGEESPLGEYVRLNEARFRVIGIMERKGRSLGIDVDDIVYVPVGAAEKLFNTNALFEIIASARSHTMIDQAKAEIGRVLRRRHHGAEDFTVIEQRAIIERFSQILGALTWVLGAIASVSLLVGGIGIMNMMLVSVSERTQEIGIRKAVGARRGDILAQFLVEAAAISLAGGLCGVAVGAGGGLALSALAPGFPIAVTGWAVATAVVFSVAVGMFFGVHPALKAAALHPIVALRYE